MPQDLPGFFFDPEKNRYFPIKGPIPGSKPQNASSHNHGGSSSNPKLEKSIESSRKRTKSVNLLQARELCGKLIPFNRCKNFQLEYLKLQASQPRVWKYQASECKSDSALQQLSIETQTPQGKRETNALLMGSTNGSLSIFEAGGLTQYFESGLKCMPDRVWPSLLECKGEHSKTLGAIWRPNGASVVFPSNISCIKKMRNSSCGTANVVSSRQLALVTVLGSGAYGGSVFILNQDEPLDLSQEFPFLSIAITCIIAFPFTIWNADCNPNGIHAAVGMNRGAALINLETQAVSWVCECKNDIFSVQFDPSGNVLLCGFRNGAIVATDVRQKPESQALTARLPSHRISLSSNKNCASSNSRGQRSMKHGFKVRGNVVRSSVICSSSAICSIVSLQSYDWYFLASSMDGIIKLYDYRMSHKGAVQSYEGHVNTHSHLQMGLDPSESLLMSGGEDGFARIWSVQTGELLCAPEVSDSAVSTVCWSQSESPEFGDTLQGRQCLFRDSPLYPQNRSWGAWLGSREELFFMHGS